MVICFIVQAAICKYFHPLSINRTWYICYLPAVHAPAPVYSAAVPKTKRAVLPPWGSLLTSSCVGMHCFSSFT